MPTYLLHGFRWPRPLIRIHIVMQNIDDAAPEWLVAPHSTLALLKNFHELYPECMQHLGRLRFVEQYDPNDTASSGGPSQPFAYVADLVEELGPGVEIDDIRGKGVSSEQWIAITELRDKIAPEEQVGWYVVVCGDEERAAPPSSAGGEESALGGSSLGNRQSDVPSSVDRNASATSLARRPPTPPEEPEPKGLKKFLSLRLGRKKSRGNLRDLMRGRSKSTHSLAREVVETSSERPPPLPTGVITHTDGSSSTPSIPPSATASTPPLPDDIAELPALTPASSHGTPPPSDFNFIPEIEAKTKDDTTYEILNGRGTAPPEVEPKYANMPPIDPLRRVSTWQHGGVSSMSQRFTTGTRNSGRRNSELSTLIEGSARPSDASSNPRQLENPELRHSRRVMSFPNVRSGAVSPLTMRSISPSGRSGAVSPIGRSHSPIRSGAVSPMNEDEQHFAGIQRRTTWQLRQQRRQQMPTLNTQPTQPTEPTHQRSASQETDEDEEMEEVIMMSPAVRAPPKHLLRRSGTASTFMSPAARSAPGLDSIVENDGKPYFGQEIDANDLVAVNLENAFDFL